MRHPVFSCSSARLVNRRGISASLANTHTFGFMSSGPAGGNHRCDGLLLVLLFSYFITVTWKSQYRSRKTAITNRHKNLTSTSISDRHGSPNGSTTELFTHPDRWRNQVARTTKRRTKHERRKGTKGKHRRPAWSRQIIRKE
jgi:hypothetical protein